MISHWPRCLVWMGGLIGWVIMRYGIGWGVDVWDKNGVWVSRFDAFDWGKVMTLLIRL